MLDAGNQEGDLEEVDIELSPICLEAFREEEPAVTSTDAREGGARQGCNPEPQLPPAFSAEVSVPSLKAFSTT